MKKKTLQNLEQQMVRFQDLISLPVVDNKESLVVLESASLPHGYKKELNDMEKVVDSKIIVRSMVLEKLLEAQNSLKKINSRYSLYVTYGYRSLRIQRDNFLTQLKKTRTFFPDPFDLYEEIHRYIAVPTVAGHPTGGAVDVVIYDNTRNVLDFGSKQYDFTSKKCYTFYSHLSRIAKENRRILRNCMMNVGFAPFDGEWWHFSYGDREWAYYYKKKYAIYDQVVDEKITTFMV